jgi:hypothetical protein
VTGFYMYPEYTPHWGKMGKRPQLRGSDLR